MAGKFSGFSQYLYSFAKQGVSANEAHRRLREVGLKVRRQDFQAEYRTWTGAVEKGKQARNVRHDRYYTKSTIIDSPKLRKRNYRYDMRVDFTISDTGAKRSINFSMADDRILRPQDAMEYAANALPDFIKQYEIDIDKIVVGSVWHKEGRPW